MTHIEHSEAFFIHSVQWHISEHNEALFPYSIQWHIFQHNEALFPFSVQWQILWPISAHISIIAKPRSRNVATFWRTITCPTYRTRWRFQRVLQGLEVHQHMHIGRIHNDYTGSILVSHTHYPENNYCCCAPYPHMNEITLGLLKIIPAMSHTFTWVLSGKMCVTSWTRCLCPVACNILLTS